jgi:dipeptidyl aminopeptidase/acylaminoacyl peptidase
VVSAVLSVFAVACGGDSTSGPSPQAGQDGCPYWSPDGKWIAFDRPWKGWGKPTASNLDAVESDVLVVDRAGRRPRRLTRTGAQEHVLGWRGSPPEVVFGRGYHPIFEDGPYGGSSAIYAISPSGKRRAREVARLPDAADDWALSPDGRLLVVGFDDEPGHDYREFRVGPLGRDLRVTLPHGHYSYPARWSPDSRRLGYNAPKQTHIFLAVERDGRVLGRINAYGGSWSPDGNLIALVVYAPTGDNRVVISRPDGSHKRQVAFTDGGANAFSRDARLLFYERDADVRAVTVDGRHDRRIAPSGADGFTCLAVSPDGDRLAFLRITALGGISPFLTDLVVMNADGTDQRKVPLTRD